jgi:hypothetical protein
MIALDELRRIAGRLGLGLAQAEHEYVLLCALDGLSQTPSLRDAFALKGGTALRQLYFADWRHSVDLDFSVAPGFPAETLRARLLQWFAQVEALHGVALTLLDLHRPNGAARVRARFVGPLAHPNRLLLDITLDEALLLPWERRPVVTALFDRPTPQVLCYSLDEILAEKLRAILQRGKARDYYDVWCLLKEKRNGFDPKMVRTTLEAKCAHRDLPQPRVADFVRADALALAEAYWTNDLAEQLEPGRLPAWDQVIIELASLLADLLA